MKASKEAKAEAIALLALEIPKDFRPVVDGIPFDEFDREELLVIAKHLAAKKQEGMLAKIQEGFKKSQYQKNTMSGLSDKECRESDVVISKELRDRLIISLKILSSDMDCSHEITSLRYAPETVSLEGVDLSKVRKMYAGKMSKGEFVNEEWYSKDEIDSIFRRLVAPVQPSAVATETAERAWRRYTGRPGTTLPFDLFEAGWNAHLTTTQSAPEKKR